MPTPDLLTVTEAAAVLRIGRTASYELARRDLATGGGEGLGVVRVGGQLRVPRAALERLVGGPLSWPLTARDARRDVATVLPTSVAQPDAAVPVVTCAHTRAQAARARESSGVASSTSRRSVALRARRRCVLTSRINLHRLAGSADGGTGSRAGRPRQSRKPA
jgi:hypothetical protein